MGFGWGVAGKLQWLGRRGRIGIGGERMPKAQAPIAGPGWGRDGSIARPFGTDQ
jgi:hypothetical protein